MTLTDFGAVIVACLHYIIVFFSVFFCSFFINLYCCTCCE